MTFSLPVNDAYFCFELTGASDHDTVIQNNITFMRSVINISLPQHFTKEVERGVKQLHFASKSEFFRHLLREWMAGDLVIELEESRAQHKAGKSKLLKKTKDLWV